MPRTIHLEDSRMPNGEIDKDAVRLSSLFDKFVVIEEKVDGTGVGISFDKNADVTIQTRGKIANTKQFTRLHAWTDQYTNKLWEILSDRYVMFGEWCYAKHTIFYDSLWDYFLESDIYDKEKNEWLSTYRRQELLMKNRADFICSVPILKIGKIHFKENIKNYVGKSFYRTEHWREKLKFYCDKYHYDFSSIIKQTDDSLMSEGLYIKHEDKDKVLGRYKYVRYQFLETILNSGSHFQDRAIIPNIMLEVKQ